MKRILDAALMASSIGLAAEAVVVAVVPGDPVVRTGLLVALVVSLVFVAHARG